MSLTCITWPQAAALGAVLALAMTQVGASEDCARSTAPETAATASTRELQHAPAGDCWIDAKALQTASWQSALVVDARRSGELEGVHLPEAIRLRRSELDGVLHSARELPVLLVGSGLDDASLLPLCARLAEGRGAPVAVLGGGLPTWLAAGRALLLPAADAPQQAPLLRSGPEARQALASRMRLSSREFALQLRNPQARVLSLDHGLSLGDAAAASVAATAREANAVEAELAQWLDARGASESGPAIVLAPADAGQLTAIARLASKHAQPFWLYVHPPGEPLPALAGAKLPAEPGPLRREACAWN